MIKNLKFKIKNYRDGQSLLEVMIAVMVAIITILAAITVLMLMLRITSQDVNLQTAIFLEEEMMDNLMAMKNKDWQRLVKDNLGIPIAEGNDYHLIKGAGGDFLATTGREVKSIDGADYEAFFHLGAVNRDLSGNIVESGGLLDPSTKKIDVFINWDFRGETAEYSISRYLMRDDNYVFQQTDWSGGATKPTDPAGERMSTFYNASSTINFRSQPGELKLSL